MPEKDLFIQRAQRYMDDLFRLAFSWLKSRADADDVTQTVLLRLYETDKIFESEEHVRHWLVRVTINECKKYWRSPWRRTEDFTDYANTLVFEQPEANGALPEFIVYIFPTIEKSLRIATLSSTADRDLATSSYYRLKMQRNFFGYSPPKSWSYLVVSLPL